MDFCRGEFQLPMPNNANDNGYDNCIYNDDDNSA